MWEVSQVPTISDVEELDQYIFANEKLYSQLNWDVEVKNVFTNRKSILNLLTTRRRWNYLNYLPISLY